MDQKSSGRPPDHGILKKGNVWVYGHLSDAAFVSGNRRDAGSIPFRCRACSARCVIWSWEALECQPGCSGSGRRQSGPSFSRPLSCCIIPESGFWRQPLFWRKQESVRRTSQKSATGLHCRMELSGGRRDRAGGDPARQPDVADGCAGSRMRRCRKVAECRSGKGEKAGNCSVPSQLRAKIH